MASEDPPTVESIALAQGRPFGEGLRAARQHLKISLEDVVAITKVRRAYLQALEEMNFAQLPSRPFAEGYVRAYAKVLGLDEGMAIARLRQDWPMGDGALPEPLGVSADADPRIGLVAAAGALVIVAIVIWNIAQRAMAERAPPATSAIAQSAALPAPKLVDLGQPLPPPIEATLPAPYVTPGLEPEVAVEGAAQVSAPVDEPVRMFQVKGKIYGAPAASSVVTLQAVNNVYVILRGKGDSVQEIQELKAGESYRAPAEAGLAIDVTAPSSVEVYVAGQYKGRLTQSVTQLSALSRDLSRPAPR